MIFTSESITIESTLVDCNDIKNGTAKQYQSLEVKNLTASSIQVRFKKQLWYGGKCTSCQSDSEEYVTSVRLEPNGSLKGDCESNDKQLKVFVRMLNLKDVSQLTHFELVDVEITEL